MRHRRHRYHRKRPKVLVLHRDTCTESEEDFDYMQQALKKDSKCINRPRCHGTHGRDNNYYNPPLSNAFHRDHLKCMKFLLENGANPNGIDSIRCSVMDIALQTENYVVAELLLQYGLDPDHRRNEEGSNFVWYPVDLNVVRMMFARGAVTDEIRYYLDPIQNYYNPLVVPYIYNGEAEIVKLFLLHDAITDFSLLSPPRDVFDCEIYGDTIPHCIIKTSVNNRQKSLEEKKRLFHMVHQFGVNLHQKDKQGRTVMDSLRLQYDYESWVLIQLLSQLMSAPLSLQSLSRLAIKKVLGRELLRCTEDLVGILPPPLIEFLKFPKE